MMPRPAASLFLCLLAVATSTNAIAEQITIDHTPIALTASTVKDLIKADATVDVSNAAKLIDSIVKLVNAGLKSSNPPEAPFAVNPGDAYLLHVVQLRTGGKLSSAANWYVYQPEGLPRFTMQSGQTRFESARIFGQKRIWIVYVHLYAEAQKAPTLPSSMYTLTIKKKTSQLETDIGGVLQILTMKPKSAATGADGETIVGYAFAQPFELKTVPVSIDVSAQIGATPDALKEISKGSFVDEGTSPVGLSFAVPLNSYKDLSYEPTGTTIQPQTVQRQNIYLNIDLYYPKADLSDASSRYFPHLIFGIPLKSQPYRHLMLGFAFGLKYISPFAGVVFDRTNVLVPADPNSFTTHVDYRLIWGVSMSVSAAAKALGAK
jgi:hypothetical protein